MEQQNQENTIDEVETELFTTEECNKNGLTTQQMLFAWHYVDSCYDVVQGLIRAGYPEQDEKTMAMYGRRLVGNKKVKKQINEFVSSRNNSTIIDKFWVLAKLKKIVDMNEDRPQFQLKGLELLGRALALFADKQINEVNDAATSAKEVFAKRVEKNGPIGVVKGVENDTQKIAS